MKDSSEYNVRAVERALEILGCFDDEHPEQGVSEIAQAVGLHKATTHRIVTTLLNYGYIERADDGQKYRLGLRLAGLGFKVIRRMDLRREALPYMDQLVQMWEEPCDLSVFDQGEVFYVEFVPGKHALTVAAGVGRRLPPYCTASGKVFLAYLPAEELEAFLSRPTTSCTSKTITSPAALRKQLELIRQQGYGLDDEEYEVGIRAVSAPVRDRTGAVVAAIGIPGPASRMTEERISQIATSLKEAAREVSLRLGWKM